jgi:hypothetical protein
MPETLELIGSYTIVNCGKEGCHMAFAVPTATYKKWRETRETWYCPNGHPRAYNLHKSEADELRQQLAAKTRSLEWMEADLSRARQEREHYKKSAAVHQGQKRQLKARIAAGICPCCRRPFANLMRHMQHQHPDFKPKPGED